MLQRLKLALLMAASLGVALPARAEEPQSWKLAGTHVLVSVERAASALFWNGAWGGRMPPGQAVGLKPQGFDISLLNSRAASSSASLPRFAGDYVTAYRLSVGGAVGFGYLKPFASSGLGGESREGPTTELVVAPRVGYLAPLSPRLALWPRCAVSRTSYTVSVKTPNGAEADYSDEYWNASFDLQLAVVMVPRVVFTTGGLFEASIRADRESPHELAYGVTAGLTAMF